MTLCPLCSSLSLTDSGTVTYSWSFNSVRFDSSAERTYAQDGTLTFELTEANVGEYACLVSTPQGTLTSRQAVVQIAGVCVCACVCVCVCVRVCVCVCVCVCVPYV